MMGLLALVGLCAVSLVSQDPSGEPIQRSRDEFAPIEIRPTVPDPPAPTLAVIEPEPTIAAPIPPRPTRCVESRRCLGMRIGGSTLAVLGAGAIGTGIGLLVRRDRVIANEPAFVTSTHPAGVVVTTLGVGVSLTAALVLVASRATIQPSERARLSVSAAGLQF